MHQPLLFAEPAGARRVVLDEHGLVTYDRDFLDAATADELLRELLGAVPWKQEHLRLYGRAIPFPRLTAWYGDSGAVYTYSGIVNVPRAWTAGLARLRDRLHVALGVRFNSALLNLYRTGSDGMGWHADDEPELGERPVIASLSLGATRRFELRRLPKGDTRGLALEHGSLLVMSGETQSCWKHQVPKETTVRAPRVNLTFRVIDPRG
ncbi:MAG: repair system protein [Candidatus Eremiobacteraeota bacterium]|nr:repair system protein [Candidatus Eremiobacteraeota bacterium]